MTSNNNLNVEKIKAEVSKNVPELRFQGFIDAWEQRKLKEVTERVRGNDGRMDLPTLTISAGSGWLDQRERFSNNIAGKEQKNYTLLHKGELSYNHGNSKLAKYGAVFELTTYEEALVPRVYHSFKTNDSSSCFIEYMFATKRPDRELGKLVSSGARMDGLLNINFDEFMGINIILPSTNEQNKISEFLRKLDFTLTLHQRKLDELKRLKQGYLQQLFPKNDKKVPRIRFANFTDDWELRKLGDFATKAIDNRGKTPPTSDNDEYPLLEVASIGGYYPDYSKVSKFVNRDTFKSWFRAHLQKGDILFSTVGNTGLVTMMDDHQGVTIAQNIVGFRAKERNVPEFLIQMFKLPENFKKAKQIEMGAVQPSIKVSQLVDVKYVIPNYKSEQENIGALFKQLDKTIILHQSKLDKLNSVKQALLQKMFI